jgi:UDP-glucose 4-epimerase
MTKRVLVTGAAGFIGSHLVDSLLDRNYTVVGLDNLLTGQRENLSSAIEDSNFTLIEADVCDSDLAARIGGSLDLVFHLAAISSVKMSVEDPQSVNRNNVGGTVNALYAVSRLGARRFVLASSAAVYGDPKALPVTEDAVIDPLSPYAASKVAAEMYCRAFAATHGLEFTVTRYFNIYGPKQAFSPYSGVISIFINNALKNRPVCIEGDGEQTRSFVHVEDAVTATILAGEKPEAAGQIINISGTQSISINELARLIRGLTPETASEITHDAARQGDVRESIGSMERAKKILGFAPAIPFSEGIANTIEWYRSTL